MLTRSLTCVAVLLACAAPSPFASAFADDAIGGKVEGGVTAASVDGGSAEARRLVRQLGAEEFAQRQSAADRLVEIGSAAIAEVVAGAEGDELERRSQSVAVLKRMLEAGDEATRNAAEVSLRKLAKSEVAGVAELAKGAIEKAQAIPQPNQGIVMIRAVAQPLPFDANGKREVTVNENDRKIHIAEEKEGKIVITITKSVDGKEVVEEIAADDRRELAKKNPEAYALYIRHLVAARNAQQLLLPPQAGNVRIQVQMQARNINGQKQIDINENGKKIHIEDQGGKEIKIEVIENINGKEVVTKYEAKDLEDLKKNHPEGAKLYEKYANENGGIQAIQVIGANIAPGGFGPIAPRKGQQARKIVNPEPLNEQLNAALEALSETRKELDSMKGEEKVDVEKVNELQEKLKSIEKHLFAIQKDLE